MKSARKDPLQRQNGTLGSGRYQNPVFALYGLLRAKLKVSGYVEVIIGLQLPLD
jgi:hypothetical protein